jgi:hypothetical protein
MPPKKISGPFDEPSRKLPSFSFGSQNEEPKKQVVTKKTQTKTSSPLDLKDYLFPEAKPLSQPFGKLLGGKKKKKKT